MKTVLCLHLLLLAILSANAAWPTGEGEVISGAGQCEIDSDGKVYCAGGGAIRGHMERSCTESATELP